MSLLLLVLAGLAGYWFTFKEFKGSLLYLLSLAGASFLIYFLGVSPMLLRTVVVAGVIPWFIIGPYILKVSKEESRQLALYTLGFTILFPLILSGILGLSLTGGLI